MEAFQLTAARRRLVNIGYDPLCRLAISTHSRAKAAGPVFQVLFEKFNISTHSRAKAAGCVTHFNKRCLCNFNSQPREGGWLPYIAAFNHLKISTHSRAKAAGYWLCL